jgi:hypothetical protein
VRGNYTDHDGYFFGAGGFEMGHTYGQHHGWVLWCLAEHYFLSGDKEWLQRSADAVVKGMDWVFRQRRETMKPLPHSRGWESGFLPAGSLEDVDDYFYWLSTNSLTWRGVNNAARALKDIAHPEADRLLQEVEAYRSDLVRGFNTMRQHTPLVRLRNGRWVPTFPSRLYSRGRDMGWIRETLEGAVYLLVSGLYPPNGREAGWILDDFQDNRYPAPPFGYQIPDIEDNILDYGGISIQPNLFAGLMPHLDRDETEIYIRMFFNAWCACYSEEINAMVEHPYPFLGYSNAAHFKTSDESNAINWLRYMLVYAPSDTLHFGRAIPREWFNHQQEIAAKRVATRFGMVSVTYQPAVAQMQINAKVELELRKQPREVIVRFRHPKALPIREVLVDGKRHSRFDPVRGDVVLETVLSGQVTINAMY